LAQLSVSGGRNKLYCAVVRPTNNQPLGIRVTCHWMFEMLTERKELKKKISNGNLLDMLPNHFPIWIGLLCLPPQKTNVAFVEF